nr:GMC family oxidoreductase [Thiorhodococcus mannitoliphagus]
MIDADDLEDGRLLEADLAIIGGGPAGITIARAMAGPRRRVCLIESGGLSPQADTQALYQGENAGIAYPLAGSRLRYLGGTSGHWGGFCRPLDPIDFEVRDWVPHSGWPFGREALDPYYEAASEAVQVAPARFEDADYWREHTGEPLVDFPAGRISNRFFQYSPPTRFGDRYREELRTSPDLTLLLHANVTKIAALPSASAVSHLEIRTLSGRRLQVRAPRYVLAAGGLENPRILLLSNDVMPAGLGNENDVVGRFFMEHPHVSNFADLVVADLRRLPSIYRSRVNVEGRNAQVAYVPTPEVLRRERLLNISFTTGVAGAYHSGDRAGLGPDDTQARSRLDMLEAARRFLADGAGPVDAADPTYAGVWLGIGCACEPVPNPDSRVTLAETTDALGQRQIRLDWRLTEQDRRSFVAHVRSLGRELAAAGVGRLRIKVADDGQWPESVIGGNHHMGTTRMSDDPQRGVVDRDCRVHGLDSLYVAGSSVFPTAGSANPTLNILALAYRLADHLKGLPA